MTEKQQMVAIAESLGYTDIIAKTCPIAGWYLTGYTPKGFPRRLPDFIRDLNACRELEKNLIDEEWKHYTEALLVNCEDAKRAWEFDKAIAHARPELKTEAYLRAKCLWVEEIENGCRD